MSIRIFKPVNKSLPSLEKQEVQLLKEEEEEEKEIIDNELKEKLLRLQEKLAIETDKYWNLYEEFEVSQNKLSAYQEKFDQLVVKNQQLEEIIEDKTDWIETLKEKLKVMETVMKNMSETHDKMSKKVEKYEEMGGAYLPEMEDEGQVPVKKKSAHEILQKELIKVSQKLKKISELPELSDDIK